MVGELEVKFSGINWRKMHAKGSNNFASGKFIYRSDGTCSIGRKVEAAEKSGSEKWITCSCKLSGKLVGRNPQRERR